MKEEKSTVRTGKNTHTHTYTQKKIQLEVNLKNIENITKYIYSKHTHTSLHACELSTKKLISNVWYRRKAHRRKADTYIY